MRDHTPILIEEFMGFYKRGDVEACPPDHSPDLNNVQFSQSSIQTRDGLDTYQATQNVLRMYEYNSPLGEGLLILDTNGNIHHTMVNPPLDFIVMTINGMTDFGFTPFNERAYITPSTDTGPAGMANEFIYVYDGNGITQARKAAGVGPALADGNLAAANSATAGNVEAGFHVFGVVYETTTGFLTAIGDVLADVNADGTHKVDLTNIPVSPSAFVIKRHIVASKAIDPTLYTGDKKQYQLFYLASAVINDNSTTSLTVNFYDAELLVDATVNFDLFGSIPAGGGLGMYHGRMLSWDEAANIAVVRVSNPGQPEAFNQVSGLITLPIQGEGITHCHEYRDILYICKINETWAYTDNGGDPSSWPGVLIDQGIGASKHGIALVGEFGSLNLEYLLIHNLTGIWQFNGLFTRPELSWKIKDFWVGTPGIENSGLDAAMITLLSEFYHDPVHQLIYINFPDLKMILEGEYSLGLNPEKIRWTKWTFDIPVTTMALIEKSNKLLIGSRGNSV